VPLAYPGAELPLAQRVLVEDLPEARSEQDHPLVGRGFALRQGKWLADAAGDPHHSHVAEFWAQEAAKLLAPLLHAAALTDGSIGEVIG